MNEMTEPGLGSPSSVAKRRILTLDDLSIRRNDGTILFRPTLAQSPYLLARDPNLFLWGNRGGGKSFCARWHAHSMALLYPGLKYFIVRRSYVELQKTHLAEVPIELDKLGGEKLGYRWNKNEHLAYYPNGSMGFYAQCASEDDTRKVLGAEAGLIVFDESPELQWDWLMLMAASARVPKSLGITPMVRYLGNPFGPSINDHFRYFIDKDVEPEDGVIYIPDEWRSIRIDIEQNPHFDAELTKKRYASVTNPLQRRAWLLGERTVEGQLFDLRPTITVEEPDPATGTLREVKKPYHVIERLPSVDGRPVIDYRHDGAKVLPWLTVYRAFDMGWSPDPAYCLWVAVMGRQIICFREQVWNKTIAKDIAADIRDSSKGMKVAMTFCDPSIAIKTGADIVTTKDIFDMNGVPMECSINNREQYAHAIHSALQEELSPGIPRIQILKSGCPYLLKSLPQMTYDPKNPLRMADHKHDHPVVTLAYFLMSSGVLSNTHAPPAARSSLLEPATLRRLGLKPARSRR
jgi:hypothetical protein